MNLITELEKDVVQTADYTTTTQEAQHQALRNALAKANGGCVELILQELSGTKKFAKYVMKHQ